MSDSKREAREAGRAARSAVSPDARAAAASAVRERLLALPQVTAARAVLAYAATPDEIDPAPAVDALRAGGARIAYPRVCGPGEVALHWAQPHELAAGYGGIREPDSSAEAALPEDIDVVLVPGVAFDEECFRLGQGGGCYDRLLPRLRPDALRVGLAFDEQLLGTVPTEEHDVGLDFVVTPTRTIRRD